MLDLDGEGIEFAVDELVIMGYGPGDILRINEDDVEPLMDLSLHPLGMLEHVLTTGGCLGVGNVVEIAVGTVPVVVVMVIVGKTGLVGIGLLADGPQ